MARLGPRRRGARGEAPRRAAVRLGIIVGAAALAGSIAAPVGLAQPVADLEQARQLYGSAEAAMREGRFDDAARDYGASYEASKDPALLYKIGHANERAGKCDVALSYFARYLHEGRPTAQYAATTREHIVACGGDPHALDGSPAPVEPRPRPGSADAGSAASATAGSAAPPNGTAAHAAGDGPPLVLVPSDSHKVAWILTGGAVALATLGGVLAYAASSSENDVRDLYVGLAGVPPMFDTQTRQRYDDLVDQGHRYQHLSWAAFGLAGAAAAGAALLFAIGGTAEPPAHARVAPTISPGGAGIAVTF